MNGSISLKDYFSKTLKETKEQLNSDITNNPKFDDLFLKELNYIVYKTGDVKIYIAVSPDKKSVTIDSYSPINDCKRVEFRGNNTAFIRSNFYLNNDNLFIEFSQGVIFDKKNLEKNGLVAQMSYESKLETTYSLKCINKDGFEYSNSFYSDSYPLSEKIDDINIREKTLSSFYKPTFNEYQLPKGAIHVLNATIRNAYRKNGSFQIIHSNVGKLTKDGYSDTFCTLFSTHSMFPDMLRGDQLIATSVEKDGKFIFEPNKKYAETVELGFNKAKELLQKAIDEEEKRNSNTKLKLLLNYI